MLLLPRLALPNAAASAARRVACRRVTAGSVATSRVACAVLGDQASRRLRAPNRLSFHSRGLKAGEQLGVAAKLVRVEGIGTAEGIEPQTVSSSNTSSEARRRPSV